MLLRREGAAAWEDYLKINSKKLRGVLLLLSVFAIGGVLIEEREYRKENGKNYPLWTWTFEKPPTATAQVYPYSVVPGGVWEKPAPNYHSEIVTAAFEAYVSYKLKGKIYWTSHKVRIGKGELIWMGPHGEMIRARCGNGMIETRQVPTETTITPEMLDEQPPSPSPPTEGAPPEVYGPVVPDTSSGPPGSSPVPPFVGAIPLPPSFCCGYGGGGVPTKPVQVSEGPSMAAMACVAFVLAGAFYLAFYLKRRGRGRK